MIINSLREARYRAAATAKVGWFTGFYVLGRHIVGPLTGPGETPRPYKSDPVDFAAMRSSFMELFDAEWQDIERGRYKLPQEFRAPPNGPRMLRDAAGYLREARMVARRAHQKGGGTEVREAGAPEGYPAYYRQNFHFQSDGWFSDRSARAYDTQVEVLFTGAADTMRRRALALIADEVQRREGEGERVGDLSLVDIGTGTGRLLADVADNFPGLPMVGVDLSDPYLKRAKKTVGPEANARFVAAPGEKLPFADQSMDILTTVYLFHELPPKVRRVMAAEFARVLKPGGLYVHLDSVQYGDTAMDALLEGFPRAFHEPFYESYMNEDLAEIFGAEGLRAESSLIGFLSKASSFRKPLPS